MEAMALVGARALTLQAQAEGIELVQPGEEMILGRTFFCTYLQSYFIKRSCGRNLKLLHYHLPLEMMLGSR